MLLVDTFFYPDKMLNKSKILYSVRKHERLRGTVTGNCSVLGTKMADRLTLPSPLLAWLKTRYETMQ